MDHTTVVPPELIAFASGFVLNGGSAVACGSLHAAIRRAIGWIRSYDEARDRGCLHDSGGTFYMFRARDICCETLWPEQEVSFVGQISSMGKHFALLIDAVTPQETAA